MDMNEFKTIGILGRRQGRHGHRPPGNGRRLQVRVATAACIRAGADAGFVAPGAIASDAADVIAASDAVILALPCRNIAALDPALWPARSSSMR
jgi:hypothetical protein